MNKKNLVRIIEKPKLKMNSLLFAMLLMAISSYAQMDIKPTEFCFNTYKECKGVYSQTEIYKLQCEPLSCQGTHSFECANGYCGISKKVCIKFQALNKNIQSENRNLARKEMLRQFTSKINNCTTVKYDLKPADICVNRKSCLYMETKMSLDNGTKKLVCPCIGKKSVYCGINHCAVNSIACETFKETGLKSLKPIAKCESFNLFAQRKLII